jgi:hypothetical protein
MSKKKLTEKQVQAQERFPQPSDAPKGSKAETVNFAVYPQTRVAIEELREPLSVSQSQLIRETITFAHENKEEFLKRFLG